MLQEKKCLQRYTLLSAHSQAKVSSQHGFRLRKSVYLKVVGTYHTIDYDGGFIIGRRASDDNPGVDVEVSSEAGEW